MARATANRPTDGELAILRVLWERGPSTVREVHSELNRTRTTGYTTVLKLMQIMARKGLVERDEGERTHVYRATIGEAQTQKHLMKDLLERAFGGSARKLIVAALSTQKASSAEMNEIRDMIDRHKRGVS
jgi:BlaI family transcriptional regulator, penicillinase repressor